jgi:hypothetical protein
MFLDREPYIRIWRPIYRRFGPTIRQGRNLFTDPKAEQLRRIEQRLDNDPTAEQLRHIEQRLAGLEVGYQQSFSTLEQVLFAVVQDKINTAVDLLQKTLSDGLGAQTAQLSTNNAAQWAALEQLLVAVMGSSTRQSLDADGIYGTSERGAVPKSQ